MSLSRRYGKGGLGSRPKPTEYKPGDKVTEAFSDEILIVESMGLKQDDEGDRVIVNFTNGCYAYPDELTPA